MFDEQSEQKEAWAISLDKIEERTRRWLWKGRIPAGEITLIAGTQGLGKSILAIDMISHITTGMDWPDKSPCKEGNVVLLAAEDNFATTIKPRHIAAGADLSKVTVIRGAVVQKGRRKGKLEPFDLSSHIDQLKYLVNEVKNVRAIVIDPIGSYMGNTDIHRENQVRNVMFVLKSEIAEKYDIAVLGVVHLRKGGSDGPILERILGSVAFTATARTAWGVAQDSEDPDRRKFVPFKYNLAKRTIKGLEFFIVDGCNGEGVIKWGDEITELAEDVMHDQGMRPEKAREKAKKLIVAILKKGPKSASKIMEELLQNDIGERTIKTAKKELGVKSVKKSDGTWVWIPPSRSVKKVPVKVKKTLAEHDNEQVEEDWKTKAAGGF